MPTPPTSPLPFAPLLRCPRPQWLSFHSSSTPSFPLKLGGLDPCCCLYRYRVPNSAPGQSHHLNLSSNVSFLGRLTLITPSKCQPRTQPLPIAQVNVLYSSFHSLQCHTYVLFKGFPVCTSSWRSVTQRVNVWFQQMN